MLTRAAIVISGVVIASAVAALPITTAALTSRAASALAGHPSQASKGDRLRVVGEGCERDGARAACSDIFGVSGPPRSVTYQRNIGEGISVAIRMPIPE